MPTLQHAAVTSLKIQDAVNLSGVVRSFSEALDAIWEESRRRGLGTEYVNTHPIVTVYLSKLSDLNHVHGIDANRLELALQEVRAIAEAS
jgi:hypothetical protein